MRKSAIFVALTMALMAAPNMAWATNGHQLMGIGAYQKSMGGAITAAPYDTTTAISNPAGMAIIGTKADFNFDLFLPVRSVDFTGAGGQKDEGGSPLYLAPAVGWVGPVGGRDDLFFGGGMFLVSGMGVDYSTINSIPFGAQMGDFTPWKANLYSQYQFWKLAPTLAKKVNDQLYVGASLNVDYQQLAFKQKYFHPQSASSYIGADLSRAVGALGFGVTIGAIYKVNDMIQIGATYISEQSFQDMEYRLSAGDIVFPDGKGNVFANGDGSYKIGMNFPQQFAIGVAVTPTERLKITADVKWINFSSTQDTIDLKGDFALVSQTTGAVTGAASSMPLNFGWDDIMIYAVGVEYKATPMVTLRAGFNHGDTPLGEEDVFNNAVFPVTPKDTVGLGVDLALGDHWGLGFAYMKVFNNEIEGKGDLMGQTSGAKIALSEQSLLIAISYDYGK